MTAAEQAGVSYRQLDFWIRKGYIKAALPGTGNPRNIGGHEYEVLAAMADLVRAGFRVVVAAEVARRMVTTGRAEVDVGRFHLARIPEPPNKRQEQA